MLKTILILLVGVLVGANVVYFMMHRDGMSTDAVAFDASPTPVPTPAPTSAVTPSTPPAPAPSSSPTSIPPLTRAQTTTPTPTASLPVASGPATAGPSGLLVPVQGVLPGQLSNTFDDARGEGRRHDALDIMAPQGTPVLAVADGTVEKLFDSERGGLTVYQFEPGGRYSYYYAHLDRYAPGLEEGQSIRRGEVIAYVGSTGNASADAPHLHFAIFRLGPEKRWWKGDAINPYPVLSGKAKPAAVP